MFQGLEPVCDVVDAQKQLAYITPEQRKWVRENVHKELSVAHHGGGRRKGDVLKHQHYNTMMLWEKAIVFKYQSYLQNMNIQFSPETWKKWKTRFLRNWDETNKLFLECITKLQTGDILYTTSPKTPYVSFDLSVSFGYVFWVYIPKLLIEPLCCFRTFDVILLGSARGP